MLVEKRCDVTRPPQLLFRWERCQFLQEGVRSAHRGHRCLGPLLHFASFAHGLHFVHDVSERLPHRLLQDPALALALRVLRVRQGGQGGVHVLQADGHRDLKRRGTIITQPEHETFRYPNIFMYATINADIACCHCTK